MKYKTIAMEWIYKKIKIEISSDGRFQFNFKGTSFYTNSLNEAKSLIDKGTSSYYTFTQEDMDKLLSKLDNREKELVKSLYQELGCHRNNPYCDRGVSPDDWNWEWDLSE